MFKKLKIFIPVLSVMLLLFGSCLTVSARPMFDRYGELCDLDLSEFETKAYTVFYIYSTTSASGVGYSRFCIMSSDTPFFVADIPNSNDKQLFVKSGATPNVIIYTSKASGAYFGSNLSLSLSDYYRSDKVISGGSSEYVSVGSPVKASYIDNYKNHEIFTSHSIRSTVDGTSVVFQGPFLPAEAALPLAGAVNQQVGVILIIAVACLALLIILSVLRKKLPIFLA